MKSCLPSSWALQYAQKEEYGQKQMEGAMFHIVHLLLFYDFLSVDYIHSLCQDVDVGTDIPAVKGINSIGHRNGGCDVVNA